MSSTTCSLRSDWCGLAALALAVLCFAASAPAAEPDDNWHLQTGFGIWAMAVEGDVGVRGVESEVDVSFDDLLDKTTMALNPGVQLSKGDWVLAFNGMYAVLEDEKAFRDGRGGTIESDMGIADFGLGYTLVRTTLGEMPLTITPAIGVRYTYLSLELDPNLFPTVSRDRDWWDPYIGGRVVLGLTDKLNWRSEATYGGFGVGSDSTWSAATYLDWNFHSKYSLNVGYRALSWDYDEDDFEWDVTFHGPWIGLTVAWF